MCSTSKGMWVKLLNVYEQRQDRLFNKFFSIKYMDLLAGVAKHASHLEKLWMELQDETWKEDKIKLIESLFINRALNTLPAQYFEFINCSESTPKKQQTVKILTGRLCTVELLRQNERMLPAKNTALLSKQRSFTHGNIQKGNPGKKKACFYYKDEGHFIAECPKLKNRKPKDQHNDEYVLSACALNLDRFKNFDSTFEIRVNVANETCVSCTGKGNVDVILSKGKAKTISNVLHMSDLTINLLSVSKLTERKFIVVFDNDACKVFKENKVTIIGAPDFVAPKINGINMSKTSEGKGPNSESAYLPIDQQTWHRRLGHLNYSGMKKLKELYTGLMFTESYFKKCVECLKDKDGTEYTSHEFEGILKVYGIDHQNTVPYTLEHGGVSERMNGQLSIIRGSLVGSKVDLTHPRIFGCDAYAPTPKHARIKWDSRAQEYTVAVYPEGTTGYWLHDSRKPGQIIIATDVEFLESPPVEDDDEENDKSSSSLESLDFHRFEEREVCSHAGNVIVEVGIVDNRNYDNQAIAEPRYPR
ncbi:hypothetical protein PR048_015414 [Dryococelus australis]|uniref:GAG-pre-integrase domain-containing protein n=1 Tax=Dryococelus australis TaxID=614101 RepID=A0ABQ9HH59_9NEOP|nr:hypothetical protein PR048_015414 [Dryococelus australis]